MTSENVVCVSYTIFLKLAQFTSFLLNFQISNKNRFILICFLVHTYIQSRISERLPKILLEGIETRPTYLRNLMLRKLVELGTDDTGYPRKKLFAIIAGIRGVKIEVTLLQLEPVEPILNTVVGSAKTWPAREKPERLTRRRRRKAVRLLDVVFEGIFGHVSAAASANGRKVDNTFSPKIVAKDPTLLKGQKRRKIQNGVIMTAEGSVAVLACKEIAEGNISRPKEVSNTSNVGLYFRLVETLETTLRISREVFVVISQCKKIG